MYLWKLLRGVTPEQAAALLPDAWRDPDFR